MHALMSKTPEHALAPWGEDDAYMEQAMLLEWMGQAPITIHRPLVEITGNVLAALWLSYALNCPKLPESSQSETVVAITGKECEQATGISRAQQLTCRRDLVKLGIVIEQPKGRSLHYRIQVLRILELLRDKAVPLADSLKAIDSNRTE